MNNEKNCIWHFDRQGVPDKGPNNPLEEHFKAHPYYSIVREAIQNSLDAVDDISNPVKVIFKFGTLSRKEYPNLVEGLRKHIIWSKEYWKHNSDAERKFDEMLRYLDGGELGLRKLFIPYLKISDYNTKGMYYQPDDTNSTFYAFLKSEGNSSKSDSGSGGSFGFGKAAYFSLSPFRTIIVSTRNLENEPIFEGATVLATHKNLENGTKLSAYGYYNADGINPVMKIDDIPEDFIREKNGTDIYVLGLWEEEHRKNKMIKSVLNNFWLAIHNEKLVVEVEGELINKDTLSDYIYEYYPDELEKGSVSDIYNWNPRPYFNAVRNYGIDSSKYFLFEEELEMTGKVKLYVHLEKDLPNRIAFFRKPQMLVYKETKTKIKGYVAVFVCEGERGNEILKKMENPAHNEWKKENYRMDGKPHPDAKKVKKEIYDFIIAKLNEISEKKLSDKITVPGLEEYLNIPADLLSEEETFDYKGNNHNVSSGDLTDIISEKETGAETTVMKSIKINPNVSKPGKIIMESEGSLSPEGEEEEIAQGNKNNTTRGTLPGFEGSDAIKKTINHDESNKVKRIIQIEYRVIASGYAHRIIMYCDKTYNRVSIEFYAGTDNGKNESLKINNSSIGTISGNILNNVRLKEGKNIFDVEFDDNIQHALNLKVYELQ